MPLTFDQSPTSPEGLNLDSPENSDYTPISPSLLSNVPTPKPTEKPPQSIRNEYYGYTSDPDETPLQPRIKRLQDNWCVRNIFQETPIVGAFFAKNTSKCQKLSKATQDICGLATGAAAMLLVPSEPDETQHEKIAKLSLAMTAGMFVGRSAYNVASSSCKGLTLLYGCCLKRISKKREYQASNPKKTIY